jgi:hypothetical protein
MHTTRAVLALTLLSTPAFADSITKQGYRETEPSTIEMSAGAYRANRSLLVDGDDLFGGTSYDVPNNGLSLELASYPVHHRHANGFISSAGVSLGFAHSVGGDVTVDDSGTISTAGITQRSIDAAAHYRLTAWRFSLDTELGVGNASYRFDNDLRGFGIANTSQTFLAGGAQLGFNVFRGITLAGGAKLIAGVGGNGDLTDMDVQGPGQTTGFAYEASLTVPLPKGVFVRAQVASMKLTTEFDAQDRLAFEMPDDRSASDTTTTAGLSVGLRK